jgi:hypothetical protein
LRVHELEEYESDEDDFVTENAHLKKQYDSHMDSLHYENPNTICYALNTSCMLVQEGDSADKVFRPELIAMLESGVKSDAGRSHRAKNCDTEQDWNDLSKASEFLNDMMIPSLVHTLDSLTVIPVDSDQLENVFHVHGVNMRHLGKVSL